MHTAHATYIICISASSTFFFSLCLSPFRPFPSHLFPSSSFKLPQDTNKVWNANLIVSIDFAIAFHFCVLFLSFAMHLNATTAPSAPAYFIALLLLLHIDIIYLRAALVVPRINEVGEDKLYRQSMSVCVCAKPFDSSRHWNEYES